MQRGAVLISLLVILWITLPYVLAAGIAGPDHVFSGFLLNPQDGYTYLAKMRQGWEGSWQFKLPFTSKPGQGTYLNLFYLFLGHLADWIKLPLVSVYHLARLLGSAALLASIWFYYKGLLPEHNLTWTYGLAVFGAGLGWLFLPLGWILSDFWVAEAYPFLSMYSSPHFSFGLALLLGLLHVRQERNFPWTLAALMAFLLSWISPFGIVVGLGILGVWFIVEAVAINAQHARETGWISTAWVLIQDLWRKPVNWPGPVAARILIMGVFGGPALIYDQRTAVSHPALSVWNVQNLTLTPAAWDVFLALSPAILLGLASFPRARMQPGTRQLLAWLASAWLLVYLPFSLQRRFMMGMYVPIAGLAGLALSGWVSSHPRAASRLKAVVVGFSLPTLLLVTLAGITGVARQEPLLTLTHAEMDAFTWIEEHTPPDALILASPDTGLLIPAMTARRVLYGHPYETVNAEAQRAAVSDFFEIGQVSGLPGAEYLSAEGVNYVFYGPRERLLGRLSQDLPLMPVYQTDQVTIYQRTIP